MYLCGATPQTNPHIGHVRSGVAFDIAQVSYGVGL